MIKKTLLTVAMSAMCCCALFSQEENKVVIDNSIYLERYKMLTGRVGDCGMGVETLLDKWEAADSKDINMMLGRFNFFAAKSVRDTLIKRTVRKYLGEKPVLSLKDSSGVTWYYFTDRLYDKSMFDSAIHWLDKAIAADNTKFELYLTKAGELINFEKENPRESLDYILTVIDKKSTNKSRWSYLGQDLTQEVFNSSIQDICATFYNFGSDGAYEAFRQISEKMLKYQPDANFFLDNMGTYYLVVKKNYPKAKKYYQKSLKINPSDEPALKNMEILKKLEGAKSSGKKK